MDWFGFQRVASGTHREEVRQGCWEEAAEHYQEMKRPTLP